MNYLRKSNLESTPVSLVFRTEVVEAFVDSRGVEEKNNSKKDSIQLFLLKHGFRN